MQRVKSLASYSILFILLGIFIFTFASYCFAETKSVHSIIAPEPGTMALLLTGMAGWVVRFARRRFAEFKKVFDIVAAAFGMVFAAPIIALTGLLIKAVSPGPIFYKQLRVGKDGHVFHIYKLRTMRLDAEKVTGPTWARENDPRLIKYGKLIRKAHLDELPQLFNVLKGEMSIVGPRPERPIFVDELSKKISDYQKRLHVKPGITGLAQVVHKYDETIQDVKKKVKYDLLYIKKMCFLCDLRILFLTVFVALTGKGAR